MANQQLMPCGHPQSAVVSSGEGTSYCDECAEGSQHSAREIAKRELDAQANWKRENDAETYPDIESRLRSHDLRVLATAFLGLEEQLQAGQSSVSTTEEDAMTALDEARSFFEGTTERPLDYTEALAWDLFEQLETTQRERDLQFVSGNEAHARAVAAEEQLETVQRERDEWAREFKRVQDIGLANAAETAALINAEMEEQLEASSTLLDDFATKHKTPGGLKRTPSDAEWRELYQRLADLRGSNPASETWKYPGGTYANTEPHSRASSPAKKPDVSERRADSPSAQGVRRAGRAGSLPTLVAEDRNLPRSETSDPASEPEAS